MEAATPTPYKPPAQENLKLSLDEQSLSNFWPPEQKEKKENQNKTPREVGSVHVLPVEAGSAVLITESGGPHRCPSPTLQTGVFKTLGFLTSFFFFLDSPESSWDGRHLPLASSKMPSKQWMFSEPAKILEPISWRTEHQVGPRNPEYLMQESHPLEIIELQRFFLT